MQNRSGILRWDEYRRGLQMLLTRIAGQGRISELLDASDSSLEVDTFFRRMNWSGRTKGQAEALSSRARAICESYCTGANNAFARRAPWELKLLGYRPEPWTVEDILLVLRMLGYVTLAQSQGEMERLLSRWSRQALPGRGSTS